MFRSAAPKPANFDALSKAWNDPQAFARELANYYEQIKQDVPDRTIAARSPRER